MSAAWAATNSRSSSPTRRAARRSSTRRPDHPGDRRALHDRPDRDPHRRVDRLRLRPDRRRDGRRSDPQGRPCAVRSQGRRPRHRPLFLVRAAVRAGGPGPARERPARRDRGQAVPPRLPAAGQRQEPEADRLRGADPLEPSAARHRPAQRLHPGRRGSRPDAGDRRMGDRGSVPRRRHLARADHRRAQHQPQADHLAGAAQHRQRGARPPQASAATGSSSRSPKACSSATMARRSTC